MGRFLTKSVKNLTDMSVTTLMMSLHSNVIYSAKENYAGFLI